MSESSSQSPSVFQLPIRIYIEDTDAGGVVYHSHYLKYLERSRTEFLRSLGYGKAAIMEDVLLVVHGLEIQYLAPALLDDEIVATASISKLARTYIVFQQEVYRSDQLLCKASVKIACVSNKMRPVALPSDVAEALKAAI